MGQSKIENLPGPCDSGAPSRLHKSLLRLTMVGSIPLIDPLLAQNSYKAVSFLLASV
jgi:hypothetical protein